MEHLTDHLVWYSWLVAGIIPMITGFIWYHDKTFGNAWMSSLGKPKSILEGGNMPLIYGLAYLFSVLLAFASDVTIEFSHWHPDGSGGETHSNHTFGHGMLHGAIMALFFVVPVITIKALFERFSLKYILIHIGYWVLTMSLITGVVDSWN